MPLVMTELKSRGCKTSYIACVDDLKGFPEAIASVYPHTDIQFEHRVHGIQ